jgi:hypothetical protein
LCHGQLRLHETAKPLQQQDLDPFWCLAKPGGVEDAYLNIKRAVIGFIKADFEIKVFS